MSKQGWDGTWRGRSPASAPHTPARNIVRYTGAIVRGKFPSAKTGRMVGHEKLLELDAIYLFETAPQIERYVEQPEKISFPDGPRLRRYTPDFLLTFVGGRQLTVEVKPRVHLEEQDTWHRMQCVAAHMARVGREFIVLTDEVIRQEPRLSNLKWIYHQAPRLGPTPAAAHAALRKVGHEFPVSIRRATGMLAPYQLSPFSLMLMGLLVCDLQEVLTLESLVRIDAEGGTHGELFAPRRPDL